jgi:hypothetical protein
MAGTSSEIALKGADGSEIIDGGWLLVEDYENKEEVKHLYLRSFNSPHFRLIGNAR